MSSSSHRFPFVSVIIPTYNRCDLLGDLLDSLCKQTYPPGAFEVIVVDNGSGDGTESLVDCFLNKGILKVSYYRKNFKSAGASRQFALSVGLGEIIAFVDSDCVVLPEWLERGVAAFEDRIGLVQGKAIPNPNQPRYLLEKTVSVTTEGPSYETCNIFYRKAALEEVGGFSPEYEEFGYPYFGEDIDLALKVKRAGYGTTFCEEALAYHQVFRVSFWQWFLEMRSAFTWPYIVMKFPEIRKQLYKRYFLFKSTAFFVFLLVGVLGSLLLHWPFVLLGVPYLVLRFLECGKGNRKYSLFLRFCRIAAGLPRTLFLFLVLLCGSIRFRCLVL